MAFPASTEIDILIDIRSEFRLVGKLMPKDYTRLVRARASRTVEAYPEVVRDGFAATIFHLPKVIGAA